MSGFEIILALVIAVGLVGVVVPLMPGTVLIAAAVGAWAIDQHTTAGWIVSAVSAGMLLAGIVVKYLIPGRLLQRSGVPRSTLLFGAVAGIVGFFVIPVVGLPVGFVLGVYAAQWQRVSPAAAWPATRAALQAIGLGILVELGFGTLAAGVWAIGAATT